ncbi:two component transcriptional regulator [Mycobacteroides abscessus subsp. massiliense]|uniref:response regulator transcription factor n=1 Tax=Mycobacteroides abscessus TaxID=36809 RepID=UPI0009A82989|nr:response regulator transcription factor [Mycobacteroides abscessus]SKQ91985.1 two component transcriptional regulator [Mycobacteroides abscessus subsp. massiliense]SKR35982.1 two component transcriptional regulator [Mycobacteroides abscessus subsp. massiliense]SKT85365.1 two component transcriptional regulator [Mycobacteroides abscessus subsp. massiliense]SKU14319.1 two component transcriptional regulator [Mycobacteroides abscessus subsp. massiliense]SLA37664.1 two component transcriptional
MERSADPNGGHGAMVVLVEDDRRVRAAVSEFLRAKDFRVSEFADGQSAREALPQLRPDVLVLDRMLPGLSGDDILREVRTFSDVPVIMVTALGASGHRIDGLELGADDYLVKPFAMRELQLRITKLLRHRRARQSPLEPFVVGRFRIDPTVRRITDGGREISLTGREYELFLFLLRNPGRIVSRDEILREVWGWNTGDGSTVTVHVRRLREKIEQDPGEPDYLRTEWGAGYRFTPSGRLVC